ncbi:MAG TPA: hypothetical protein VMF88_13225 [Bacteroidota bacterium]|nr:hypothetical protein [Bacteroidota bacterium]
MKTLPSSGSSTGKRHSGFLLSKWYLDCIAHDGTTFVGYAAQLRWKSLSLRYSSFLIRRVDGSLHSATSFLQAPLPHREGAVIHWSPRPLKTDGEWNCVQPSVERELYKNHAGSITWSCCSPMTRTRIAVNKSTLTEGIGYAERLTISIPPWQLPIELLRWGRFHSENDSLVWIDWRGPVSQRFLFHNSEEVAAPSIADHEIEGAKNLRLSLKRTAVLRDGPIISDTLAMIPGAKKIFPHSILQLYESKWLSRGEMVFDNSSCGSGWAIHELVSFR